MWPKAEDLLHKGEEGGIQLQVRHLHIGVTRQVSLCKLGLLPEYQTWPAQVEAFSVYPSQPQTDTYVWSAEQVFRLSSACSLYHLF